MAKYSRFLLRNCLLYSASHLALQNSFPISRTGALHQIQCLCLNTIGISSFLIFAMPHPSVLMSFQYFKESLRGTELGFLLTQWSHIWGGPHKERDIQTKSNPGRKGGNELISAKWDRKDRISTGKLMEIGLVWRGTNRIPPLSHEPLGPKESQSPKISQKRRLNALQTPLGLGVGA